MLERTLRPAKVACFSGLMVCALTSSLRSAPTDVEKVDPDHAAKMTEGRELFTKQVRQVLIDQCVKCHGGEKTRSGLDLATREGLLKGGDNGPSIVLGKAKESRLYKLIAHVEEPFMPAKLAKLNDKQIAGIAQWIDLGAPYDKPLLAKAEAGPKKPMIVTDEDRKFWAFQPLHKMAPPKVNDQAWCRTPIDLFILAKLEEKKLSPNPTVDRRKLVRRAYFDLIGLPPTPEEIDEFVNDKANNAYVKLLDRLLDNPHFGERWARHWLDIARFAESHGYEQDYDRPFAYHYRDFVINAFNQDLPYDTFVKWQIAGDEFEPENPLALMATGFLGAGVHSTQITKNQVEKERYDELDDMTRTVGTAMLGLTVGCARCHDHKYDPIPTRDYYRMVSTFTTTVRSDYDINMDPKGYQTAKAKFDAEHQKLVEPLTRFEKEELPKHLDAWLAKQNKEPKRAPKWAVLDFTDMKSEGGTTFVKQDDGSILASGTNPAFDTYTFVSSTQLKAITAIRLEALAHSSMVKSGPGRADNGNFALTNFRVTATPLKGEGKPIKVKLVNAKATFEQAGLPVAAAIDNDPKSGWAVDPQFGKDHAAVFETEGNVGFEGGTKLTFVLEFKNNNGHNIGRPRLSVSTVSRPVGLEGESMPPAVITMLSALEKDPQFKLSDAQRIEAVKWYRTQDADWVRLTKVVEDHQKAAPKPILVKAMICSEGVPAIRNHTQGGDFLEQTHFLNRGDPNQKVAVATQGFLQVLMRHPDQEKHWLQTPPANVHTSYRRRALANWMTDLDTGAGHLLARVIVNRLWQHHTGRGLVATPSDFGYQGDKPTHPELLDWLAQQLIDNGWRLKTIHKLIMQSAVYQESAAVDQEKSKVDPDNRLCWRHPRQRLEAEAIRDSLLAVSGSLDSTMFGPGTLDLGMKRRSIYFFVKRSQLIPPMMLFDAPDTLQGLELRSSTVIAPQALMLINSAIVRGFADSFAAVIEGKEGVKWNEVVATGYMKALGRQPTSEELKDTQEFLQQQAEAYQADGKKNARHLAVADFCQVLMGLNEFIYVE